MKEAEMARIADLIADVLRGCRPAADVKHDAVDLRRSFPALRFCFPPPG